MKDHKPHQPGQTPSNAKCELCGKEFPIRELLPAAVINNTVTQTIKSHHPEWDGNGYICQSELAKYRGIYVQEILEREIGEVTDLEQSVIDSLKQHQLISETESEDHVNDPIGARLADRVASVGGSWNFIAGFGFILAVWILFNSGNFQKQPFDPYPFILLNLCLSCLAAIQAPVIMMSQNRQEIKDRERARNDYRVNLKAELEIRHLHEKIDHLLIDQWKNLADIQQQQMAILEDLAARR